jgi:hypothetical protein
MRENMARDADSLTAQAQSMYVPFRDTRRLVREKERRYGLYRKTPVQEIRIMPGYYARLARRTAAIVLGALLAAAVLYLLIMYLT